MDHFSIAKTAKKAVIERISDDTFGDTNVKQVSDEQVTKAKPLAQARSNRRQTIYYLQT